MQASIFTLLVPLAVILLALWAALRGPNWMRFGFSIALSLIAALTGFAIASVIILEATSDNNLSSLGAAIAAIAAGFGSFLLLRRWTKPRAPSAAPSQYSSAQPRARASSQSLDVFISYKRDERALVHAIAERLKALKLSVWFDADIHSGKTFDAEIDRHVRRPSASWCAGRPALWRAIGFAARRRLGASATCSPQPCWFPAICLPRSILSTPTISPGG